VLTGDLPCIVEVAGQRRPTTVHFELDLREHSNRPAHNPKNLLLSTILDGTTYAITDDWFEDGTLSIDDARPDTLEVHIRCGEDHQVSADAIESAPCPGFLMKRP
jgi:hypothetical protein